MAVDGNYNLTMQTPMGNREVKLELTSSGNDLSGSFAGPQGNAPLTGTVNGEAGYGFLLTALDGSPDKFRIKNWTAVLPPDGSGPFHEWFALATVLFDFRDGWHESAHRDASRALALSKTPSCRACILIVRALAGQALGKGDAARRDLDAAAAMIGK